MNSSMSSILLSFCTIVHGNVMDSKPCCETLRPCLLAARDAQCVFTQKHSKVYGSGFKVHQEQFKHR